MWLAYVVRALDFAHMFAGEDEESKTRWQPLIARPIEQWAKRAALLAWDDDSIIYGPM
jgi:hypothetical protein